MMGATLAATIGEWQDRCKFLLDQVPDCYVSDVERSFELFNNQLKTHIESHEFVYLIYNHQSKLFKIGRTKNPDTRIKEISAGCGCEIALLLLIELEASEDWYLSAKQFEKFLHRYYRKYRVRGEWFKFTTEQLFDLSAVFWKAHGNDVVDNLLFERASTMPFDFHTPKFVRSL